MDVFETDPAAIRALLLWNDRGNVAADELGSDDECCYSLVRSFASEIPVTNEPAGPTLADLFERAKADLEARGYDAGDVSEYKARTDAEALALLIDPEHATEAADMVAHWVDRCGLPEWLASDLLAAIETNYATFQRG